MEYEKEIKIALAGGEINEIKKDDWINALAITIKRNVTFLTFKFFSKVKYRIEIVSR